MNKTPEWLAAGEGFTDVTLSRPLDVDGTKVSTIRMREPNVGDQRASDRAQGGDGDKEVSMFANLCALTPADLDRLPLKDYKRLQAAFVGFID